MNLDALGNIGDFLGGVGVIITLVYLAAQIRQNTAQLRSNAEGDRIAAFDETTRSLGNWQEAIFAHSEVASLWERGLAADDGLDSTEVLRFEYVAARLLQIWQSIYRRSGRASDAEHWAVTQHYVRLFLRQPGFLRFWENSREMYLPDFINEIDRVRNESAVVYQGLAADD